MTKSQIELARHALGLPNKQNMTYRNHFCIGEGADGYSDWEDLVKQGYAVKAPGSNWTGDLFYLTLEGAREVLKPKEQICKEDVEKMCNFSRVLCRFNDGNLAIARFKTPNGCVCFPDDREQDLCMQHIVKNGMIGPGVELIKDYRSRELHGTPIDSWYKFIHEIGGKK